MTISLVLVGAGVVLLAAALLNGLESQWLTIPELRTRMRVAIGLCALLLLAAGVTPWVRLEHGNNEETNAAPAGSGSPGGPSAQGPKPDCPGPAKALPPGNAVDITNLKDGDPVDYRATDVWGTVTLAPGNRLWFFGWAPVARRMYILGGGRPEVENGRWTFSQLELGDGSGQDEGKYFCITAMVVDEAEDAFLENLVSTRRGSGWALEKGEMPREGLASTAIVFLRQAKRPS